MKGFLTKDPYFINYKLKIKVHMGSGFPCPNIFFVFHSMLKHFFHMTELISCSHINYALYITMICCHLQNLEYFSLDASVLPSTSVE